MKEEYITPQLSVEALAKSDVLLSSPAVNPTEAATEQPAARELENSYRDITQFIFSGDWVN